MNNEPQEKNNFNALLKDVALTCVYIKEKAKTTLPELEKEDSIVSLQTIKDIVDRLCESVRELKTEKEEALSALVAKNMLYDAALEQICKLRLK